MANRIKVAIASSILTLRRQGWSLRKIARTLGVHRETVARYVRLEEADSKPAACPEKVVVFSGSQSRRGKSQSPRSLSSGVEGNRDLEAC